MCVYLMEKEVSDYFYLSELWLNSTSEKGPDVCNTCFTGNASAFPVKQALHTSGPSLFCSKNIFLGIVRYNKIELSISFHFKDMSIL